jgi:hypothetical protein
LGKFRSSDFKIKQSPATHIFIGGSLVETNIIDELIIRLKHKVKLPMVLFPEIHRRFLKKPMPFVSFPDIRKKSGLPNRVSGKSCTHLKRTT